MRIFLLFLLFAAIKPAWPQSQTLVTVHEGETITLPENPQPQPEKATFWSFRRFDVLVPLRTNREAFHDKTWRATQSVWLGAIIYDSELTHQGLAHHNCVEGNRDLSHHPSRAAIYLSDLPAYSVGTAFNYLALRFVGKPLIFEFAGINTVQHLIGGSQWLERCW
jgi:hypothetical protein